jgi:hypothetical protein
VRNIVRVVQAVYMATAADESTGFSAEDAAATVSTGTVKER